MKRESVDGRLFDGGRMLMFSGKKSYRISGILAAAVLGLSFASARGATSIFTISTDGYAKSDTNSCAIGVNNVITSGNFQFVAFYDSSQHVMIARRDLTQPGTPVWTTVNTGFSITDASDDHNVIAMGIDGTGIMHLSWDMHNVALNYATTSVSVLGASFGSTAFNKLTSATAPTLFPLRTMDGTPNSSTTNEVTYPQFYNIPNSNQLLFAFRNGGPGGGSGNGNQFFDIYDPVAHTWSQTYAVDGVNTSVNAYLNSMVYTSTGTLEATWTYRATPNWQTNQNIMFGQSPDNGVTWQNQAGVNYALPIVQNTSNGGTAAQVAQIVKTIPMGDSFINQTSMTVDHQNHSIVATYFAPGFTPTSVNVNTGATTGTGNVNRQYELVYYTGTAWATSQISNRTHDTSVDAGGGDVRDLGRPVVLVDRQNRILVITRSTDAGLGASNNDSITQTGENNIVIYYTTDSMVAGDLPSTLHWQSITLDAQDMGIWEPTYDSIRWDRDNVLDLFYEPVGLTEQTRTTPAPLAGDVSILEWDEQAFFNVPEPASLMLLAAGGIVLLRRRR